MLAARVASARHRHGNRINSALELQLRHILPYVTIGCVLGVFNSVYIIPLFLTSPRSSPIINDPTYTDHATERPFSCRQFVLQPGHEYTESVTCIRLKASTSTTIELELTPSVYGHTLKATLKTMIISSELNTNEQVVQSTSLSLKNETSTTFGYSVRRLHPCTEYGLTIESFHDTHPRRRVLCTGQVATKCDPPRGNLIQNPSFEHAADSPFLATRRDMNAQKVNNPRQWTPFYDGGARRTCGVTPLSVNDPTLNHSLFPRSGNCAVVLGKLPQDWAYQRHSYYGIHTTLAFANKKNVANTNANSLLMKAWFAHWRDSMNTESRKAEAKLILSWTLHDGTVSDGVSVPLVSRHKEDEWVWEPVCVQFFNADLIRAVHIFFHLDAAHVGDGRSPGVVDGDVLGIDDVTMSWKGERSTDDMETLNRVCYSASINADSVSKKKARDPPQVHLQASESVPDDSLTIAVPMTADRALRLETLAKAYGGGSVVAAVVVKDEAELGHFISIWRHKWWLRRHVNVTFIRRHYFSENESNSRASLSSSSTSSNKMRNSVLGINLIRNVAVALARTRYVAMLDVDMIPATREFACLRRDASIVLNGVLPKHEHGLGHGHGHGERKNILAMAVLLPDIHVRQAHSKEEARDGMLSHSQFFYCAASQRGTKLRQWFGTERGNVRLSRFLADYEPFAVARREDYPAYDERFVGYGFNKVAWLMKAQAAGWRILVSGDLFVSHMNHVEMDWVAGIRQDVYVQTWRRFMAVAAEVEDVALGGGTVEKIQLLT